MSVEAHQQSEVDENTAAVRAVAAKIQSEMGLTVTASVVADDAEIPAGSKKVHFIRHGEGHHNVAQREWRAKPDWDGTSEPYTIDNDPEYSYGDALLTDKGESEARLLQERTQRLSPTLLVVSPMRRATQTGLIAFEPQLSALPVVAHELCHERAGRHTCDKRLDRAALAAAYPKVGYELIESEADPYWLGAAELGGNKSPPVAPILGSADLRAPRGTAAPTHPRERRPCSSGAQ